MDVAQFRLDFPEFADDDVYTDGMCEFWSGLGEQMNSLDVFGSVYNKLIELFTAHNISIQAKNIAVTDVGGVPTGDGGALSTKTVGSITMEYDTASSSVLDAGDFNLTSYGRQYVMIRNMFSCGVMQV